MYDLPFSSSKELVLSFKSFIKSSKEERDALRKKRLSEIKLIKNNTEKYVKKSCSKYDFVETYFIFDESVCGVPLKYKSVSINTSIEINVFSKIQEIVNAKGLPTRYNFIKLNLAISNESDRGFFFPTQNALDGLLKNKQIVKDYIIASLNSKTDTNQNIKETTENRDIIFRGMFQDSANQDNILYSDWNFMTYEETENLAIANIFNSVSNNIDKITMNLMLQKIKMSVEH